MQDRISPAFVLILGLAMTTLAFGLWAVESTALERAPLRQEAATLLDEPPVQEAMSRRVANAIGATVPSGSAVAPEVIDAVADRTLDQPAFVSAFATGLEQVQARVAHGAANPIVLDPVLVGRAARDASANEPTLSGLLVSATPLPVEIPVDEVPDLEQWSNLLERAARVLVFIGLVLITYGLLRVEHKPWAFGRIGRWALVVGLFTLLLFWAVPHGVFDAIGGWVGVAGVVIASDDHLVPIALLLVAGGALTILVAHQWEARDRKRFLSVIPHTEGRTWQSPV